MFVQALIRALHALRLGEPREIDEDFARQMMSTGEEPEAFSFDEPDF